MGAAADPSTVVRAVFFGSGSFAVPILDTLVRLPGVETVAVVSAPDRPVGRKAVVTPTPVTALARELGLAVLQPIRVRRPEAVAEIARLTPDLVILADYGQLIPAALLDLPQRGFLNLHPSALPRWRGAAPIPATILTGDRESAVTLMVVAEEMDAGPIVATAPLEVRSDDTAATLEERASHVAAELLARALPDWLAGRIVARPQPIEGVTLTRPLRREDGRLDPEKPAAELERQIRAYQPWPGSFVELPDGRMIIWKASVGPKVPGMPPGRFGPVSVPALPDESGLESEEPETEPLYWTTRDGRLILEVMQIAGGRRMGSAEYRRGHPNLVDDPGTASRSSGMR